MLAIKTFKQEFDYKNEEKLYNYIISKKVDELFLPLIAKDSSPKCYKLIMERGACDLL